MALIVPKQSTPLSDAPKGGDPEEAARIRRRLFSVPWWSFFSGVTDAMNAIQARLLILLDAVLGFSTLTTVGRIPKVSAPGTLTESGLFDDGVNVGLGTLSPLFDLVAGRRTMAIKGVADCGVLELAQTHADGNGNRVGAVHFCDENLTAADKRTAIIIVQTSGATANDRGAAMRFIVRPDAGTLTEWARLEQNGCFGFGGNTAPAYPVDVTGDINTSGVYRVAGTQVLGAQGAAVTPPSIVTSTISDTADATYSANEVTMLNNMKAAINQLNTAVLNLGTTETAIIARLQASTGHGVIAG